MKTIWTIGHSTRAIEEFLALLQAQEIALLADVRTIPKSRANPQFNSEALAASLNAAGIEYRHLAALGGLRHARKDSENSGWKNASFRGYADYMLTEAFAAALADLETLARERPTAIMCAEAVPWRCHRSLIADALNVRGWKALEIIGAGVPREHKRTSFSKVERGRLTYPAA